MAVYVTGDTHGSSRYGLFSVDGFMSRLSTDAFPEQKDMSKDDFVVILGDFGGVWESDRKKFCESPEERHALDWLEKKPFTTVFVPGNHENYDRLTGCRDERLLKSWLYSGMPETEKEKLRRGYEQRAWHGGMVRVLRPSVMMLERGWVFDLDGLACFAFGGARSHDIRDGILDPADYPDKASFERAYRKKQGLMIRVKGISWWEQEMPTKEEMEEGMKRLRAYIREHGKIDYIFTHDCPAGDRFFLGYPQCDELNRFFEEIRNEVPCRGWFYGHLHDNRNVFQNHHLLYEQIVRIR